MCKGVTDSLPEVPRRERRLQASSEAQRARTRRRLIQLAPTSRWNGFAAAHMSDDEFRGGRTTGRRGSSMTDRHGTSTRTERTRSNTNGTDDVYLPQGWGC